MRGNEAFESREQKSHLQHSHLLAVTKQAEGKGVLVVEAGADLAASEGQGGDVALQVVPVLVEEQLVVFQAAPALSPAVIGQHVQVACQNIRCHQRTSILCLASSSFGLS